MLTSRFSKRVCQPPGRPLLCGFLVQRQIQCEHIHSRFAEKSPLLVLDVAFDQRAYAVFAQASHSCDPRNLEECTRRSDVGIEARTRGCDEVGGNGLIWILSVQRGNIAFHLSISFWFVGPRFDAEELAASYPLPAADGREWKYRSEVNGCPMLHE
jgi:hypothetical protein